MSSPGINKINKIHCECIAVLVGREARRFALDNLVQLFEDGIPLWIGKKTCRYFLQRYAQ